jgi:hypothetical protein
MMQVAWNRLAIDLGKSKGSDKMGLPMTVLRISPSRATGD